MTAQMERNLARHIVSASDLRDLGIMGLGVRQYVIDTALRDSTGDVTKAALRVIRAWSSEYTDKEQAYRVLRESLRRINRTSWIKALTED